MKILDKIIHYFKFTKCSYCYKEVQRSKAVVTMNYSYVADAVYDYYHPRCIKKKRRQK